MTHTNPSRGIAALCVVIALAAGVVSALGVFARGDGSTAAAVSVRGEHYEYATTGVYAFNAQRVVAEGVGWDILTLAVAVPALLVAAPFVARGSLRARAFALGVVGYLLYQYLEYSLTWAFGPLFLPFVAIWGACLCAIVWLASTLDLSRLAQLPSRFPRRGIMALCWGMSALLVLMWSARIIAMLKPGIAPALLGQTTLVVQALDLGLVVPFSALVGVAAWKRTHQARLLAAAFLTGAAFMSLAICAMLLSAWLVEGALEIVPLVIFGTVAASAVTLGARVLAGFPSAGAAPVQQVANPAATAAQA